jgi:hypothetical protein
MSSVEENVDIVRRLLHAFNERDWEAFRECYLDDAVEEYPQSMERIVGIDDIEAVNRRYPGLPDVSVSRIYGGGDLVVAQEVLTYGDGSMYHAVTIWELRDRKVARETAYFGPVFEIPEWRKPWIEPLND